MLPKKFRGSIQYMPKADTFVIYLIDKYDKRNSCGFQGNLETLLKIKLIDFEHFKHQPTNWSQVKPLKLKGLRMLKEIIK